MKDTCVQCGHQANVLAASSWACSECGLIQRIPLTAIQRETERILANMADLPVGKSLTLEDIAHDGFGGMTVKRHSEKTFVFQRTGFIGRSRWADGLAQCYEELETYVLTGLLREPDRIVGF